jgi:hypothetical protein
MTHRHKEEAYMIRVSEQEFRQALYAALDQYKGIVRSVVGPKRSGAVASVYAAHYLGAEWLPCTTRDVPDCLRPVLVVDTARRTGRSIRKMVRRVKAEHAAWAIDEPPNRKFWYEK